MDKLISKTKSFMYMCNKIAKHVEFILLLPPHGENSQEEAVEEVRGLFRQLNKQSTSLEEALICAIKGDNK